MVVGKGRNVAHCPRVAAHLSRVPNLLQHDNVLWIVVELETRRVLDLAKGSLFARLLRPPQSSNRPAASHIRSPASIGSDALSRQTCGLVIQVAGADDLRDLWNQQTPFAISKDLQPLFLQRLKDSFADWDLRDGKADWAPEALAANANVFLDDFLLFDVAKPITGQSHLEIEKSTLQGHPYQTGGGRTIDATMIDILLTWLVNHDREFLQGGATGATKPGMKVFPYFATPNTEVQVIVGSVELAAPPNEVWFVIGQFSLDWHPAVARVRLIDDGVGQLRKLETRDGSEIVERLEEVDNTMGSYRYTLVSGVPASHYAGVIEVRPKGSGSVAEWRIEFLANNQPDIVVRTMVSALVETGLGSLMHGFAAAA